MAMVGRRLIIGLYARASGRGERLVLRTDWEATKRKSDFVALAHIQRYEWVIQELRRQRAVPRTLLDMGCGSGYGTERLAQETRIPFVAGIDISRGAIAWGQRFFGGRRNLWFKQMDALSLTFPSRFFDVVASFDVLEHLTEREQHIFLRNMADVVETSGTCYVGCPNASVSQRNCTHHKHELSADEFATTLYRYFGGVQLLCQDLCVDGVRTQDQWHDYLVRHIAGFVHLPVHRHVRYDNLGIFNDRHESAFGLLAICTKPKEVAHMSRLGAVLGDAV